MKNNVKIYLITFFILLCSNIYPLTIYLRNVGYAHGNYIELKEIAFIEGNVSDKWKNLVLGKTSRRPQTLTAEEIKQIIDSKMITHESYTIIGNKIKIITPFTKITQFEMETEIKKTIKKQFPTDWRRTFIIFTREIRDVEVPLGNYKIYVDVKNSELLYGRKRILIRIFLDNRLYKKLRTSIIIQGRVRVLFARRRILPGQRIKKSDVMFNEILLQKNISKYVFSVSELNGSVAKRYIPQGGPITRRAIKKKIIVNMQQDIEILYRKGTVVLFAEGEAQESGALGDIIKVKSKFNGRIFKAKIIGSSRVEIYR